MARSHGDDDDHRDDADNNEDSDNSGNYYSETHDEERPKRKKVQGKKSGVPTWLWVVMGIMGTCALVCCGGAFWFGAKLKQTVTQEPAKIDSLRNEMVSIEIPEGLQPVMGLNWSIGMTMKMAIYSDQVQKAANPNDGDRVLILLEMRPPAGSAPASAQQMRQGLEQGMKNQQGQQNVSITERETRKFTIQGEEIEFEFAKGTSNQSGPQTPVRQVTGVFNGKAGAVMLVYVVKEEKWNEAEVTKMIESIGK